jgi:hypothetical protein
VVLGVPHIVSDLRYLVLRPGFHRRPAWRVAVGVPLVLVSVTANSTLGLFAVLGAALVARGTAVRKGLVTVAALAAIGVAARAGFWADLALAHLHNFLGVALWWSYRARVRRVHFVPLLAFALAYAALFAGAGPWVRGHAWFPAVGAPSDFLDFATGLSPVGGPWLARFVMSFAFAQSVHYSVWLRLVPEEGRDRPTPRSFLASYRALLADFGGPGLLAAVACAAAVMVWALLDLAAARDGYLRAALFHGHLELAVAALVIVEHRRLADYASPGE